MNECVRQQLAWTEAAIIIITVIIIVLLLLLMMLMKTVITQPFHIDMRPCVYNVRPGKGGESEYVVKM